MNYPYERTYADAKAWNPNIGKIFYELHPHDDKRFRTVYVTWNPFMNTARPVTSNWLTGTPTPEMKPYHPLLKRQLYSIPQYNQF